MGPSFTSATFRRISSSRFGSKSGLPTSAFIPTISCTMRARSFKIRMSSRSTLSTWLLSSSILACVSALSTEEEFYLKDGQLVSFSASDQFIGPEKPSLLPIIPFEHLPFVYFTIAQTVLCPSTERSWQGSGKAALIRHLGAALRRSSGVDYPCSGQPGRIVRRGGAIEPNSRCIRVGGIKALSTL